MLESSAHRILDTVRASAVVLDVGAWGKPFTRADLVLDHMPYETRGLYGHDGPGDERFSEDTWFVRDICDRTPWPLRDKSIDFAVCSHTLEDVRDPIWVCQELMRVAKAGYVEVPSRLEEQSLGIQGSWAGWGHHRWLIDVVDNRIQFVLKHHVVHSIESHHFPLSFHETLEPDERVETLWWEGSFAATELLFTWPPESYNRYLDDFVAEQMERRGVSRLSTTPSAPDRPARRLRAGAGRVLRRAGLRYRP